MAADPNFRLTKGTLIDTQKGFVDAFNYVYENLRGLDGGQNVSIDKRMDGAWQINVDDYETESNGGGSGDITLSGTDDSSCTGSEFKFESAANSNISVIVDSTGNITIGAYYV